MLRNLKLAYVVPIIVPRNIANVIYDFMYMFLIQSWSVAEMECSNLWMMSSMAYYRFWNSILEY